MRTQKKPLYNPLIPKYTSLSSKKNDIDTKQQQKSITPTKRAMIDISQNKQQPPNRSRSNSGNSQNRVSFQRKSSTNNNNRESEKKNDEQNQYNSNQSRGILKKNPKAEGYTKQQSIDPEIINEFETSMNAYYSTLNQFKMEGSSTSSINQSLFPLYKSKLALNQLNSNNHQHQHQHHKNKNEHQHHITQFDSRLSSHKSIRTSNFSNNHSTTNNHNQNNHFQFSSNHKSTTHDHNNNNLNDVSHNNNNHNNNINNKNNNDNIKTIKTEQSQSPSKFHTPSKQLCHSQVNFTKMSQRNQETMFKDWCNYETIGKWESKKVSSHKQIERATIESTPEQNSSRKALRVTAQRQRDYASQIVALPGSQTQRKIQDSLIIHTPTYKNINLNLGAYHLQQQKICDSRRSQSRNHHNDSSSISAILTTPKNIINNGDNKNNNSNNNMTQSNLFSQYLKNQKDVKNQQKEQQQQQQQPQQIQEQTQSQQQQYSQEYVSQYKQEYRMKTNVSDIMQQENLMRKRDEEGQKKQQIQQQQQMEKNNILQNHNQQNKNQLNKILASSNSSANKNNNNNIKDQNILQSKRIKTDQGFYYENYNDNSIQQISFLLNKKSSIQPK